MQTINPINYPICFKCPERTIRSPWTKHIPVALYLMDLLRPKTFIELGTYLGTSYCACCQAAKELELPTRCYAVDTWRGDEHGGYYGPEILADLRLHHDPLYGTFSRLMLTTFDEALGHFVDGSRHSRCRQALSRTASRIARGIRRNGIGNQNVFFKLGLHIEAEQLTQSEVALARSELTLAPTY